MVRRLFTVVALLTLLTGSAQVPRVRPLRPRVPVVQPVASWPKYCGNVSMTGTPAGSSPINTSTAVRLNLAWKTAVKGPIASAPSVYREVAYIGDWGGFESAIDVVSGKIVAQTFLGKTFAVQCYPSSLGITSSPAIVDDVLYLAGGDDNFYALDRETLDVVWKKSLGDTSAGYYGWSSPAVVGDRVLQGIASNCDNPFVPGRLVALDRHTGTEVAGAQFISDGKVGNGVWTSPAVDMQNRTVFVTTASGLDWSDGLGYSIVRVNLDTLAIEDSWKVNLGSTTWDGDWGSSPTLFFDRNGQEYVGAGHKDGHYYAFQRSNLAAGPVWRTPVSQSGDAPQDGDGTISTAAFDGARIYVGGGNAPNSNNPYLNGTLVAIDPATGKVLWRHGFPAPVLSPVSTVNGVVFAAGGNLIEALNGKDGSVLWSFRTDQQIYGGIAIAGDTIYVGDLSGQLYAFRIS
jgi:outer membrane protein assembly factor BamB